MSLPEVAKICIYAVIILTCIKIIRGEDFYGIEEIIPTVENNAYIAILQGESVFNAIVAFINKMYEFVTAAFEPMYEITI